MMKIHSIDQGHVQVNYFCKNPKGKTVYYCIQATLRLDRFIIYRTCRLFEPQNISNAKVPLRRIFELPTGDSYLEAAVRTFIQEN